MQRSDIHDTTDPYTHDTKTDGNGDINISKNCDHYAQPNLRHRLASMVAICGQGTRTAEENGDIIISLHRRDGNNNTHNTAEENGNSNISDAEVFTIDLDNHTQRGGGPSP